MPLPFEIQNQDIKQRVLAIIDATDVRMTFGDVVKQLSKEHQINRKDSHAAIKQLIHAGELTFTYEFGLSFVERSFHKPVRITDNIIIKPPDCGFDAQENEIVIDLQHGASFGSGRHPTTRLSLKGLEYILQSKNPPHFIDNSTVLDIGTGSGVLVIAAVKMGIGKGLGIDIDPCAVPEAKENIKINGLETAIEISNQSIQEIDVVFSLVMANLRFPTIKQMLPRLYQLASPDGNIVLSGLRVAELSRLKDLLRQQRLRLTWESTAYGWAAVSVKKGHAK
jgi:ribosomal protein L11 methyltransferase